MSKVETTKAKRLIKDCLHGQKWLIFASCVLSSAVSVAYIVLALMSKKILDIATSAQKGNFYRYVAFMAITVLLQLVFNAAFVHIQAITQGKMSIALHKRIFESLFKKKYFLLNKYHSGEILNRFVSDTEILVTSSCSLVPTICATLSKLIAGTVAIISLDWKFGICIIAIGVFIPGIAKLLGAKYKKLHKDYQASNGVIKSYVQELVINMPIVKSFTSFVPIKRKLSSLLNNNFVLKLKRNWLSIITSSGFYLFFTAGYFLVLIWGASGIQKGVVTYGSLIAFLQIISQLRTPMQSISGFLPQISTMLASAERICEIEIIEDEFSSLDQEMLDTVHNVFCCIKAENLEFAYNDNSILENCSFEIKRGQTAVITGESGQGKSTLFKILLGYEEANGKLTFDGKYDINASTRSLFSYVPQGNMILSGTILENLTICCDKPSKSSIDQALETAVLKDWIDSLENGLNTKIGEHGIGVSEGQAQRLAIARALLCNTPVLLLDEATCSLDNETEHKLLWNLKKLPDKTVVLVTHRTVEDGIADISLHLDNKKFI